MIEPKLLEIIYDASSIRRWNDYPRLVELTEIDKQSHKFIIAYFLASFEENVDLSKVIEYGIFEFFRRVIITDIRPDVFRKITKTKEKEINSWFLEKLKPITKDIQNGDFFHRMSEYFNNEITNKEKEILKAAHYLSTRWEFQIIEQSSAFLHDIKELRHLMDEEIHKLKHVKGFFEFVIDSKLTKLIDLFGRLRFQIRWAQTPRVPQTTVLGHMLIVSILSYFYSISIGACKTRIVNNFFTSLFHDLPEALTKDIISPVKKSIPGLENLILDVEIERIKTVIMPLVPRKIEHDFLYFLGLYCDDENCTKDEFKNRVIISSMINFVKDIENYNYDEFMPIDGVALKAFDDIAAFSEAAISIGYGIKSQEFSNATKNIIKKYQNIKVYDFDVVEFLQKIQKYFLKEH